MVVQCNFSLELINASSMQPIPEHSSSTGKTFVTMTPNTGFLLRLMTLNNGVNDERSISYKTFVSNNTSTNHYPIGTTPRHALKRRRLDYLNLQNIVTHIFHFNAKSSETQSYDSMVMEKVTVQIYEDLPPSQHKQEQPTSLGQQKHQRRKLLETITIQCCVFPVRPPGGEDLLAPDNACFLPPTTSVKQGISSCYRANNAFPGVPGRSQITPAKTCRQRLVL